MIASLSSFLNCCTTKCKLSLTSGNLSFILALGGEGERGRRRGKEGGEEEGEGGRGGGGNHVDTYLIMLLPPVNGCYYSDRCSSVFIKLRYCSYFY